MSYFWILIKTLPIKKSFITRLISLLHNEIVNYIIIINNNRFVVQFYNLKIQFLKNKSFRTNYKSNNENNIITFYNINPSDNSVS